MLKVAIERSGRYRSVPESINIHRIIWSENKMNGVNISMAVAVSTSIFALIVIFYNLYGNFPNGNAQPTIAQIPTILQENDKGVEQNNLQITDKTQIDPLDAILLGTKYVSAQPSDLTINRPRNEGWISSVFYGHFQFQ